MKIEMKNELKYYKLEEVLCGELFFYVDSYYIKTHSTEIYNSDSETRFCVNLESGCLICLNKNIKVRKIEAKVVVLND